MISFLKYGSVLIVIVGIVQYFNVLNLAEIFGKLYSTDAHTLGMIHGLNRVVLTGGDPNTGAAIALYFIIYNLIAYLNEKHILNLILLILLSITLIFTSSRTGLIAFSLVLMVNLLILKKERFVVQVLIAIIMLLLAFF